MLPSSPPSVRVGPYTLRGVLGSGSFATVYLAERTVGGELVAVKAVAFRSLTPSTTRALLSEVQVHTALALHPNVVKLHEVLRSTNHIFLVMDYVPGGDLQRLLKRQRGGLSEALARRLVLQLVAALTALARVAAGHRDLKPSNLLLTSEDPSTCTLKLADFGFARPLLPSSTATQQGTPSALADTLCGSPLYMDPALIARSSSSAHPSSPSPSPSSYDAVAADMWSFGVIVAELLRGDPPFTGANPLELLAAIERNPWVHGPAEQALAGPQGLTCGGILPAPVSRPCADLITRLLRRDPLRRLSLALVVEHPWVRGVDAGAAVGGATQTLQGHPAPAAVVCGAAVAAAPHVPLAPPVPAPARPRLGIFGFPPRVPPQPEAVSCARDSAAEAGEVDFVVVDESALLHLHGRRSRSVGAPSAAASAPVVPSDLSSAALCWGLEASLSLHRALLELGVGRGVLFDRSQESALTVAGLDDLLKREREQGKRGR
jgi:hypothetical protein